MEKMPNGVEMRLPAAGYKLSQLIEDKADVWAIREGNFKWDMCAGAAILEWMGASMHN